MRWQRPCEKENHLQVKLREVFSQGHKDICGRAKNCTQGSWLLILHLRHHTIFSSTYHIPWVMGIASAQWQIQEQLHDLMFIDASMWLLIQNNLWKKMLKFVELNRLNWPLQKGAHSLTIFILLMHPKSHKFRSLHFFNHLTHAPKECAGWNTGMWNSFFFPSPFLFLVVINMLDRH